MLCCLLSALLSHPAWPLFSLLLAFLSMHNSAGESGWYVHIPDHYMDITHTWEPSSYFLTGRHFQVSQFEQVHKQLLSQHTLTGMFLTYDEIYPLKH